MRSCAESAPPLAPDGAQVWAPWLGLLAVIGIIYGALACLAQRDLKRMIAYSSVGHMGFVLLGIATLTPVGINAALFGNVAHGLITGLLFFLAGAVKDRWGTTDMDRIGGGMLGTAPRLASVLTFASVASLGLPGLAGFWGEMLAMVGAYRPHADLPRGAFVTFMALAGIGALLTAGYFLRMLAKITHGPAPEPLGSGPGAAVSAQEYAAWVPLIALTLLVGYGHLAIGLSLLSGLLVRVSSIFGIALMLVYWMAHMDFPYIGDTTNFLIDEHIVYALVLGLLIAQRAGHAFGLDEWAAKLPAVRHSHWLGWATA